MLHLGLVGEYALRLPAQDAVLPLSVTAVDALGHTARVTVDVVTDRDAPRVTQVETRWGTPRASRSTWSPTASRPR